MSLIAPMAAVNPAEQDGGRGGIRTHGGFPHARFRVECLKPDSATLPQFAAPRIMLQQEPINIRWRRVFARSRRRFQDLGCSFYSEVCNLPSNAVNPWV